MKKIISLALAVVLITTCMSITAFADNSATVFVSIADKGQLVVAMEEVTVTDIDNDGALTVNDALYAVHEAAYPNGASKGYGYYNHKDYGLSLGKLWGDSSGNFGYYLNNKSCWSLADTVNDGDCLNAFIYSDSKYFSDKYAVEYSKAPDYFKYATRALEEMVSQIGNPVFDSDGIMQKGVIIRHLLLPSATNDAILIDNGMRRERRARSLPHISIRHHI